ncbi:TPA: transcription elongation factor Spt5 [Candidatus Bathyarchaeota archaeon]|nr:transcription elongation factor Spt5 [Candidatus Bathyarchaeota archaeon]
MAMPEKEKGKTFVFAVRTTVGQERNVLTMIAARVMTENLPIKAIIAPETVKGYVFIEAAASHHVLRTISGIRHARSMIPGPLNFSEIEPYIVTEPMIKKLRVGDIVEIVAGPFKGERAKIARIDPAKEDVTIELLGVSYSLPLTVNADYVRPIERARREE